MRHRIFILLTCISLLLLVVLAITAIRSYWWADGFSFTSNGRAVALRTAGGRLEVYLSRSEPGVPFAGDKGLHFASVPAARVIEVHNLVSSNRSILGLSFVRIRQAYDADKGWAVYIPQNNSNGLEPSDSPSRRLAIQFSTRVLIPHWMLLIVTTILPSIYVRRRLRTAMQNRTGRCSKCGYDLRATPQRCPECGTVGESTKQGFPLTE